MEEVFLLCKILPFAWCVLMININITDNTGEETYLGVPNSYYATGWGNISTGFLEPNLSLTTNQFPLVVDDYTIAGVGTIEYRDTEEVPTGVYRRYIQLQGDHDVFPADLEWVDDQFTYNDSVAWDGIDKFTSGFPVTVYRTGFWVNITLADMYANNSAENASATKVSAPIGGGSQRKRRADRIHRGVLRSPIHHNLDC